MIKVGTCGFTYKHFKYFDVLEVQQTFYDIVSESKLQKWRKMAEENNVELTIKALQVITHEYNTTTYKRMKNKLGNVDNYGFFKNTKEVEEATEITLKEAKLLNAKIIIFQSPASFKPTEENTKAVIDYFSTLNKSFKYAWEPRGEWYYKTDLLKKVLDAVNIIHVVDPFKHESLTSERYFRLHGIGKGEVNYSYKYTDDDLKKLKSMVRDGDYVLFNNIYSFNDALRFKEILK
ncbi:DUF72 domain-containing protein [Sulfurisphaera ohwakuensis]|uniref:DUF72 domain-containing protein n=1 Tax=Sulfurisphaera ohwakuensis TaxID=69656 RepID=A0A650CIW3_SULOH|nr:DUF72 domain-containing protein [Sulfurisphaera ohwakuensis]MBB5253401.1 uncharacterized protein YecE (DUF72 family) [Sulfurisphaera ohwakuensis]QGR17719.1 DUF72 domain-containing protein [Sulfurisphaera ohwakuensis]